jgi:hypothetical protein
VLDARTAAVIAAIPAVTGVNRHALAVCPDGGTVIYADDQTVHAWSRAKRAVVATVELASPVSALACSATGRVAVGLWDGTISVRALDGLRPLTELADHHGWVYALAWSGRRLASTGGDFRVQVAEP